METEIQRLSALDSCAVSDALDRLRLPGAVVGLRNQTVSQRVAGRILTMKLGPHDEHMPRQQLGGRAIMSAIPGDIIVVEHRSTEVSGWGGLLSRAAKLRGVAAVIIDGAFRDADEIASLGLSIFSRAVVPVSARGRTTEYSFGESIVVGGVTVKPRDYVVADGSGVVFIRAERIGVVLDAAEEIMRREAQMAEAIDRGDPLDEVMGKKYGQLVSR
jgi:4-hydroxy-4-methyl-2-oxoglutarate aldolase